MRKHLRLIFLLVLLGIDIGTFANKFIVESFKPDPADVEAQIFGRKDDSNQACAIIKILSDIDGLKFETGKKIVGAVVSMPGEYWIYVSPGAKFVRILKDGFTPIEVNCNDFNIQIESGSVYVMKLRSEKSQGIIINNIEQFGDILLSSDPPGADITIENEPEYRGVTPYLIRQHPTGVYKVTFHKEDYKDIYTSFMVVPDTTTKLSVPLVPIVQDAGFLLFKVNPPSPISNIYIDGNLIQGLKEKPLYPIDKGKHKITINSPNWISESKDVDVVIGKTDSVFVDLKPTLGRLNVTVSPTRNEKAEIWINDKKTEYLAPSDFPLQTGDYSISLRMKDYPVYSKNFTLKTGENLKLNFTLSSFEELKKHINGHRIKQRIWLASAAGFGAVGGYFFSQSNKKYLEYKEAVGPDANSLHNTIESYQKIGAAAIGVAIFSVVEFTWQLFKKEKDKHWLSLQFNGQNIGLKANF